MNNVLILRYMGSKAKTPIVKRVEEDRVVTV
jgi:hypothetical protein